MVFRHRFFQNLLSSILMLYFKHIFFEVRRLEEVGVTRKRSSYLFIAIGAGSLLTRIAAGKICEYIRPIRVNQMAVLCSAISTLLLSIKSSYVVLVVLTLLYGLADGAFLTSYNVILLGSVDADKRAIAYGIGNMATAVPVAVGPMITGRFWSVVV